MSISRITPFEKCSQKDLDIVQSTISITEKSLFPSSHRVGACIELKGRCILCGEST